MSVTNFPNGVSSYGIPLLGSSPVLTTTGNVFFVDSGNTKGGDVAGKGESPEVPFLTIDFAVGRCTANNGDIIVVLPGHAESLNAAAALNLDVAGIKVVGIGTGNTRPVITVGTSAATTTIAVGAADIEVYNLVFKTDVDSLTIMIDVNSLRFLLSDCEFQETSAKQWLTCIDINGGAANACDGVKIQRCRATQVTVGGARWIELGEVADEVKLIENYVDGDFDDAAIHNPVGKTLTNLRIERNYARNRQTGDHAIELVSACTGWCVDNDLMADAAATILDPGSLFSVENSGQSAIDQGSFELPLTGADTADNFIGADNANNTAATTNVVANEDGSVLERLETIQSAVRKGTGTALAANESIIDVLYAANGIVTYPAAAVPGNGVSIAEVLRDAWDALRNGTGGTEPGTNKSIVDAIGFDGAAAVTATAGMLRTAAGTQFTILKTLTSSAVTQAGVDVTGLSTGGALTLVDVQLQADATGLAAGTNFTLETNNAKGSAVFLSHAVASLGANTLIDLDTASTSKTVALESGKKIVAKCTVADCTGGGTLDVYLTFRRSADNAVVAAA